MGGVQMEVIMSFVFAIGSILIHLFSKSMTFIKDTPRSRFLSIAGGIAVSYIFYSSIAGIK